MSVKGKPFTLYTRKRKDGKKVYYAKFKLPDGGYTTAVSTGETSKPRAEASAWEHLKKIGVPSACKNITLQEYGKDFFSWNGTWAVNRRIEGRRLGERHCRDRGDIMRVHVLPALGNMKLSAIDKHKITAFRNDLFS